MRLWDRWRLRRAPTLTIAGDVGSGPVVIMVHGIASSSATFSELVPMLAAHHRCISIDLLGFGQSPSPEDSGYTIEEHVDALAVTIESLKLRAPFVLVGHSMGGLISARYAAVWPAAVSEVVLVSPPIYLQPGMIGDPLQRAAMGLYLTLYEYLLANKDFTTASAAFFAHLAPIKDVLEVSERNWNAFSLSLQNSIVSQTTVSDIANVRVPVEVVYGAFDPFVFVGGIAIIERMRHVRIHRVEANDHLIRKRLAKVVAQVIG